MLNKSVAITRREGFRPAPNQFLADTHLRLFLAWARNHF
jgi:hypothetical protein